MATQLNETGGTFGRHGGPIDVFYMPDGAKRHPIVSHGKGSWIWDTEGRQYLDACCGPVASNIGHGNARVIAAMTAQAQKICLAGKPHFENQPNIDLADLVTKHAGPGFERAFICSGGSEANEAAIKLARQYAITQGETARCKILGRDPGYHGSTLGAAAISGDPASEAVFSGLMKVMPKVPAPFTYRLPDNHDVDSYARHAAAMLEAAILEEGPETVLAFIMEPVGGLATGALVAPDHYYKAVRDICTKYGVLLIYDEVMCGAGRTGTFLCADHWPDAKPDMITQAKGIAAGYTPLGLVLAPATMVDAVTRSGGFMHGHTYVANPLSCAVGHAVVSELIDNNLMANATKMGDRLRAGLRDLQTRSNIIGDVRGLGLLNAIEIVRDKESKEILPASKQAVYRLIDIGMQQGLLLYSRRTANGKYGEWLMVTPPLTVTEDEVDEIVNRLGKTLAAFESELD